MLRNSISEDMSRIGMGMSRLVSVYSNKIYEYHILKKPPLECLIKNRIFKNQISNQVFHREIADQAIVFHS